MKPLLFRGWDGQKISHSLHNHFTTIQKGTEVMQAIGRQDMNGNDIYEGDLIKNGAGSIGEVKWDDEELQWYMQYQSGGKDTFYFYHDNPYHVLEIIGNIYENPELLSQLST